MVPDEESDIRSVVAANVRDRRSRRRRTRGHDDDPSQDRAAPRGWSTLSVAVSPDVFSPYLTLLRGHIDEVVAASRRAEFRASAAELPPAHLKRIAELAANMDFFMGLLVALHEMFVQRDRVYRTAVAEGRVEYREGWESYCD